MGLGTEKMSRAEDRAEETGKKVPTIVLVCLLALLAGARLQDSVD